MKGGLEKPGLLDGGEVCPEEEDLRLERAEKRGFSRDDYLKAPAGSLPCCCLPELLWHLVRGYPEFSQERLGIVSALGLYGYDKAGRKP